MPLRFTILFFLWKFLLLLIVISLEKVVGLPIFFFGLLIGWLEVAEVRQRWVLAVGGALILAVAYSLMLSLSLVLVVAGLGAVAFGGRYLPSLGSRLALVAITLAIIVSILAGVRVVPTVFFYAILSSLLMLFTIRSSLLWSKK